MYYRLFIYMRVERILLVKPCRNFLTHSETERAIFSPVASVCDVNHGPCSSIGLLTYEQHMGPQEINSKQWVLLRGDKNRFIPFLSEQIILRQKNDL